MFQNLSGGAIFVYGIKNITQSMHSNGWSLFSEMVVFYLYEEEHLAFVDKLQQTCEK